MEHLTIYFPDAMLYDKLHTLSVEYAVPVETLVYLAVRRLMEDVDFVRQLRKGGPTLS